MGRSRLTGRAWRASVRVGAAAAVLGTAHAIANLRLLRTPGADPGAVAERVSVLLPVRDEAHRVAACLTALLGQESLPDLEILVLDDQSTDGTADVVRSIAGADPRVRLLDGAVDPPSGWLGKPYACQRLADAANGSVLVFVDADVVVAPHGLAATVALLRGLGADLVCPYPRQRAETGAERLVQPLLQWSYLTTLPLRLAESSGRPSLVAANGQLLAVDSGTYARAGGHAAVRDAVLEDVELARAVKRVGGRTVIADGSAVATCRMYVSGADLRDGYTKSLWAAFGSPAGALAVSAGLAVAYLAPPAAVVAGPASVRRAGLVGTAAAVAGRALVARRVGGRVWPDSAAHPASIAALLWLTARSFRARRSGTLTWKGRSLDGAAP